MLQEILGGANPDQAYLEIVKRDISDCLNDDLTFDRRARGVYFRLEMLLKVDMQSIRIVLWCLWPDGSGPGRGGAACGTIHEHSPQLIQPDCLIL